MERFNALGRGLQLMLVAGVLLLIDTFLHWQSVDIGPFTVGQTAWHGFGGVLLGLLTIVLVAWLFVRLAAVDIEIPVSASLISAFLAFLILIIAVLKVLVDNYSAWPSYVGILLAVLIAVGAWMQVQSAGGMESLKTDAASMIPSSQAAAPTAPPAETPTAAPPPPAEPAAPMTGSAPTPEPASEPATDEPGGDEQT